MGSRKKKSKIPKRRRQDNRPSQAEGLRPIPASHLIQTLGKLWDSMNPWSRPPEEPLCPCCGVPMTKVTPSEEPKAKTTANHPPYPVLREGQRNPRREDFATLEEYHAYHRDAMAAFGVPANQMRMEYVDPEFIAALDKDFEGAMRNSAIWRDMVAERGEAATEIEMQSLFAEVRAAKAASAKLRP